MAYGLKYYFEDKKIVGSTTTTYRFEILEDGYSGSSTQWTGVQIQRQYEELSFRQLNNIQKSTCTGIVRVEDATQRGVIESIAASEIGDYKVQLKKNGSVIWNGLLTPDFTSITEENYNNQTATLVAKDMLFSGDYALTSGSEKAIVIIADLLNTLGYGLNIKTYTTWTESEISASDDVLNQVYHEKERLRIYAKAAGEEPRPLTNEQALIYMLKSYGLILRQANNAWQLIQLSALDDVTAAPISTYNSSGGQLTSLGTVDLRETVDSNDLYILGSSSNNYFAGLKKVKGKFDHQSVVQGIQIPRELWLTNTNQSYTQFWQGDGTGNLSLEFNLWVADTGSIADTFPSAQIRIQSGSYYWNGIAWGTTATQITLEVTGPVTTDSDGNHIYKSGLVSIVTDPIPDAADGTLTVTFIPSPTIVTSVVYSYFRDMIFNLSYQDDIENSLSIDYEYEQDGTYNAEYDFGSFYFGDGPASASLSALKDADDNNTNAWKQIGEGTSISHVELLLREILDFQRGQRRNIRSALYGEFEPEKVVSYDSKNFFFLGGSWDSQNYQWSANLIEANPTTGTNTLTTYYNTTGAGTTTSASTGSTGSGTGTSTLYLEKANNLSDLNSVSTARDNLELGTSDSPTFAGLTVNGDISVTGNVDGRDVSADGANLDELYTTIGLSALTSAEVDQLENIDSVTISNTQWGYLGALDQSLTTISDVQFDDITSTGIIYTDNIDTVSIVWNTSTQVWDATPSEYFNNPVFIGTSLDVDNDLEVDGYANIGTDLDVGGNTALLGTLSVSGNTTLGGTLTLSGSADFNSTMNLQGNLTTQADLQDDGFSEGWAGTNWKINADGSAEFEEMRIRGALRVYEFIAKQISTIGGSEILSIAQGRIASVNVGADVITVENVTGTPGNAFKANDLWICQVVDINNDLESGGTGSIVKSVRGTVDYVSGNDIGVFIDAGDISQLEQGDLIIAYGNVSDADRQAIMYRNVDRSEDNLIMRLQTEVNSFADLQAVTNTRVAFGDLNGYSGLSAETFGFFAGKNAEQHVLVTDSGIFFKNGSTVGAQLSSNIFKIGDNTNFLSFNTSNDSFQIKVNNFDLNTSFIQIADSISKTSSTLTSSVVYSGNLSLDGLFFDEDNYFGYLTDVEAVESNGYAFRVGGNTSNFMELNTANGISKINFDTFTLDATDASGGIKIDSANELIQLEDANRVRTQVDVNNGTFSLTETSEYNAGDATVINQGTPSTSSAFQTTKGDSLYIDIGAELTSLGADGSEAYIQVEVLGSTSSGGSYTSFGSFLSSVATSVGNTVSVKFSAHSYSYDWVKIRITVFSNDTGFASQFELNQNIIVKSYDSQTRLSLDGLFVNSSNTQYARLTRIENELSGIIKMKNLPTSDPQVEGVVYRDASGNLKVSLG